MTDKLTTFPRKPRYRLRDGELKAPGVPILEMPADRWLLPVWARWTLLAACAVLLVFATGSTLGGRSAERVARGAIAETKEAQQLASISASAAAQWQERAVETSASLAALTEHVESLEASVTALSTALEEASATIGALTAERDRLKALKAQEQVAPSRVVRAVSRNTSGVEQWRGQVRASLQASGVWSQFWEDKALSIMRAESGGNPSARNGQYVGLYQFGAAWGSEANRLDATWSINRFVRVIAEGGETKVRQHWAATW